MSPDQIAVEAGCRRQDSLLKLNRCCFRMSRSTREGCSRSLISASSLKMWKGYNFDYPREREFLSCKLLNRCAFAATFRRYPSIISLPVAPQIRPAVASKTASTFSPIISRTSQRASWSRNMSLIVRSAITSLDSTAKSTKEMNTVVSNLTLGNRRWDIVQVHNARKQPQRGWRAVTLTTSPSLQSGVDSHSKSQEVFVVPPRLRTRVHLPSQVCRTRT